MLVLDLGAGKKKVTKDILKEWLNPDNCEIIGVDRAPVTDAQCDLDKDKMPFPDNSIDFVFSSYTFELLASLYHVMNEIWRVLKPNCKFVLRTTHFSCPSAKSGLHERNFNENSFKHFDNVQTWQTQARFKVLKVHINCVWYGSKWKWLNKIFNPIINLNLKVYERFFANFFPSDEIIYEMEAVK